MHRLLFFSPLCRAPSLSAPAVPHVVSLILRASFTLIIHHKMSWNQLKCTSKPDSSRKCGLRSSAWCSHGWLSACLCAELLKARTYSSHRGGAACSRICRLPLLPVPSDPSDSISSWLSTSVPWRPLHPLQQMQWWPLTTGFFCCCCSVAKSCLTLCDPIDCSTPGAPVLHYLLEFAQTHVHWAGDTIQPSHPLSDHCKDGFLAARKIFTKRYSQGSHFALGCLYWVFFENLSQNIIFHLKFHFLYLHMIFHCCFLNKRLWLSAELEVDSYFLSVPSRLLLHCLLPAVVLEKFVSNGLCRWEGLGPNVSKIFSLALVFCSWRAVQFGADLFLFFLFRIHVFSLIHSVLPQFCNFSAIISIYFLPLISLPLPPILSESYWMYIGPSQSSLYVF